MANAIVLPSAQFGILSGATYNADILTQLILRILHPSTHIY